MLVYILSDEIHRNTSSINNVNIVFLSELKEYKLPHTNFLSEKKFGLRLTELEINLYDKHYSAWMDFVRRDEGVCLILESYRELIENKDHLLIMSNESIEEEIILPFNPIEEKTEFSDVTYTLGRRIGSNAYCINKKAALRLIREEVIFLPVDELFVHLSSKDLLALNIIENGQWNCTPNLDFFLDRNKNKLITILSTNLWTKSSQQKAIDIIRYLFNLAEELELSIFLSDGTLLGFIRHGCIMGWDDDVDLSLDRKHLNRLISRIERDNRYQITKHYWANDTIIYYKIWDKSNTKVWGYPYSFPFVDIWIYDNNEKYIDFSYYPHLSYKVIFPLVSTLFYGIEVYIPNQPLIYLDKLYSNWRTSIQVFKWSHQTETASNLPLYAMIETDSNGRILLDDNLLI